MFVEKTLIVLYYCASWDYWNLISQVLELVMLICMRNAIACSDTFNLDYL